jgi:hypothetical protein
MSYRTMAGGDGSPVREYCAPDPDEQMELQRDEELYDRYIDSKLDEWRETGVRPSVLPYRRKTA